MKEPNSQLVPLKAIKPDKDQPRRNFDPARLADLMASIKKHGIISPLVIEDNGDGTYTLVDGERRYRSATELGLKNVPATIVAKQNEIDRLVQQFHLQEQHQGWSHIEKANAVGRLARELKITADEIAELLSLPRRTMADYVAFWSLAAKKEFEKAEIPLDYAPTINGITKRLKKRYREELDEVFDDQMRYGFELATINRFKSGEIKTKRDLMRLRDAIHQNPRVAEAYSSDENVKIDTLYIKTEAKEAQDVRYFFYGLINVVTYGAKDGLAANLNLPINKEVATKAKRAHELLSQLVAQLD